MAMRLFSDSSAALAIVNWSSGGNWRTRHLRALAEAGREKELEMQHIPREHLVEDGLTEVQGASESGARSRKRSWL